jgi:toxin FitB
MTTLYGDRVLAFDTSIARIASALSDRARGKGYAPRLADTQQRNVTG